MFDFVEKVLELNGLGKQPANAINQNDKAYQSVDNPFAFSQSDQRPMTDVELFNDIYDKLPIVYRCLGLRANSLAGLKYDVVVKDKDGNETKINEKVPLLTKRQNPFQSYFDFWVESSMRYDLQGELFWNLDRSKSGEILAIYADWKSEEIEVIGDEKSFIKEYIRTINADSRTIDKENVFFMKSFNPTNILRGTSPLRAGESNLVLQLNTLSFLKNFYKQGLALGGVFTTDKKLAPKDVTLLKDELSDRYSGVENMHKFMITWSGLKYQPLGRMNLGEAELMNLTKMNKEDIAMIYGIPPEVLGLGNRTYENLGVAMVAMWENTIIPHVNKMLSQQNADLLPQLLDKSKYDNAEIKADYSSVPSLKQDQERNAKIYSMGIDAQAVSRNEMRVNVFNLKPLDGEEFDLPQSLSVPPDEKPPKKAGESQLSGGVSSEKMNAELTKYWVKEIKRIEKNEKKIFSEMLIFFDKQEKDVLKKVEKRLKEKSGERNKQSDIDFIFNLDAWVDDLSSIATPLVSSILIDSAKEWVDEGLFTAEHPYIVGEIGERVRLFSRLPNETTRAKIQEQLRIGLAENESIEQIKNRIKNVFVEASEYRANLIARTEAVGATNAGTQAGLIQGEYPFKQWITSRDVRVRSGHRIDGQIVPISAKFRLKDNKKMLFPMDFNERCIMRGVRNVRG